jgi:hypothetical protein
MRLKTTIFRLSKDKFKNMSELAAAMGISASQVYRVREGKRRVNESFIIGALKAFPRHKLDELFYLVPDTADERLLGKSPKNPIKSDR